MLSESRHSIKAFDDDRDEAVLWVFLSFLAYNATIKFRPHVVLSVCCLFLKPYNIVVTLVNGFNFVSLLKNNKRDSFLKSS